MKIHDSGMPGENFWSSFFNPLEVLKTLGLSAGMKKIVDLGCGYGTFSFPAAEISREATVLAFDIEREMVETVRKKAADRKLKNIVALQRDFIEKGTGLDSGSVDYVMLFNILHAENPLGILSETHRILKVGGSAGIIHWVYDSKTPRGPSLDTRPRPEQCRDWARKAGFKVIKDEVELKPYHYGILITVRNCE